MPETSPSKKRGHKSFTQLRKVLLITSGLFIVILIWYITGKILLAATHGSRFQEFLPDFMPLPAFKALLGLFLEAHFYRSLLASLIRIVIGITISICLGIPAGLVIGHYQTAADITWLPLQFLRMVSPIAWMPIALLLLPGFEHAIIFIIAISTVWPIILNTIHGVQHLNTDWIIMAKNQGARDVQLLFFVILPGALPSILNGIRLAIGVAWIVLVPAEFLGITNGLGYLINDARDILEYDRMIALVLAIGLVGFLLDGSFYLLKKKFSWGNK